MNVVQVVETLWNVQSCAHTYDVRAGPVPAGFPKKELAWHCDHVLNC